MHAFRALLCCLCLLVCTPPALTQQKFTREQVQAAMDTVRADPLLPGKKQQKILRWKQDKTQASKRPDTTTHWWRWWHALGQRLAESIRLLAWLILAGLTAFVLVRLHAWLRLRGERQAANNTTAPPVHLDILDIRPDSLPADIGGQAAALWQRGEARAALSLLYRGALACLMQHGVPIRAACTETQCLHLAALHLSPAGLQFFTAVVQAWQGLAWGDQAPSESEMLALCSQFEQQLSSTTLEEPTT